MLKKFEIYLKDLIRGKKRGFVPSLVKILLRGLSWLYRFAVSARNWAFDNGWFRQYTPPVPVVISIGNIVVGGTGKTPVTLMIAKEFYNDFIIAILSRGYRSQAEHLHSPIVLSSGNGPLHPAAYCGDEPYLLSQNLPKAHVFVGKNRHHSSKMAARAGAQLILLDDGMQHRHLARDYEVVVLDALDPFGQGYFLPRGFLREHISSLSRADLIILNHVYENERFNKLEKEIRKFSHAPLIGTKMEVVDVLDLKGHSVPALDGVKVGLFCAIAHPDNFYLTVSKLGAEVVEKEVISDHLSFTHEELVKLCERSKKLGAEWILCTEKDFVKLDKNALKDLPIAWLKMRLTIVEGESDWKNFTEQTKQDLRKRM